MKVTNNLYGSRTLVKRTSIRQYLLGFAVLLLAACSSNTQPLAPEAVTSSTMASASGGIRIPPQADHKGPNHFDPPPLRGWDSAKWHDLTYTSPKYVFGRALVGLDPTEENLQIVAAAQGLAYLGNGRVRFPDGTTVDAIFGRNSRPRWQFLVVV